MKIKNKYIIYIILSFIFIFSLLNMNNARLIDSVYNYHLLKQIIWIISSIILILIISRINTTLLFDVSKYIYLFSLILLVLVLFIGTEINGAKAWFSFGSFSFQPSEALKLSLAIYLCYLTKKYNGKNDLIFLLKMILLTLIPSVLVFMEPDTGAIIFYLIILLVCLINSKIKKRYIFILIGTGLFFISIFFYLYFFNQDTLINLIGTSFFYRVDRLINFTDNYQITNALTLIGASSLFGSGLYEVSLYVPEAPTDFIFAFTIGNFGIISGFIVLILYLLLDILLIVNIQKANNKLFAKVFISLFLFQQLYNILMNIGILPIMGIPLPFLSYGGTSLIIYIIFLTIYLKEI